MNLLFNIVPYSFSVTWSTSERRPANMRPVPGPRFAASHDDGPPMHIEKAGYGKLAVAFWNPHRCK